jgi:murein DD-endopeptidase MepM/ murein hydrolase activator NlpD
VVNQRQQAGRYRGRRRLPKLPSRRYAAVVTTAFLGAGVVALTAGAVMPESAGIADNIDPTTQAMAVSDRLNAVDKANRSQDRPGQAQAIEQGAPDVWLLPVPTQFTITTLYQMRWGVFHWGVDMAAPCGTPYYAAHAGRVVLARMDGGYGNAIRIDHGNGVETVYGHSSKLLVTEGQFVEVGQMIGLIGTTGYSTGCHLHFEVNINGEHKDPMKWMIEHGVDIAKRLEAANGGNVPTSS